MTPTSPYARKCLMMAREKGLDLRVSVEPPHAAGSRIGQINPLVKIPVLALQNGDFVYDSRVIVEYLELYAPVPALLPAAAAPRLDALRWQALADGIADAMILIFMEGQRAQDKRDASVRERQAHKVQAGLAAIDQVVRPGQYLVENTLGLADLSVVAAFGYVGLRGRDLLVGRFPNLHAWSAWLHERPAVAETAPPTS